MWQPDILEGFECRELALEIDPLPDEPTRPVATLVRRSDAAASERAVLSVHGWNDYFFHPHVAEFFEAQGWAFYALDLRRYGRSLREGQLRGYIDRLEDYGEEFDAAYAVLKQEHSHIAVIGHSTGGLSASLWASDRPGHLCALMLNSPWLDLQGPAGLANVLIPALKAVSLRDPTTILPMPEADEVIYARSIHRDWGGEWDYSLDLKVPASAPIRAEWLRAILKGHARVDGGLSIDCPVFVATSTNSAFLKKWSERAAYSDVVLDVDRITAQAWKLGRNVHIVRVKNGLHDLFLSPPPVRGWLFEQLRIWLEAYVPGEPAKRNWFDTTALGRRLRRSLRR